MHLDGTGVPEGFGLVVQLPLNFLQQFLHFVRQAFQRRGEFLQRIPAEDGADAVFKIPGTDFQPQRNALQLPVVEFEAGGDGVAGIQSDANSGLFQLREGRFPYFFQRHILFLREAAAILEAMLNEQKGAEGARQEEKP